MAKNMTQSSDIQDLAFGLVPIALINADEHRYLLIRHHQGHWGFPKGHKEGEESDLVAAQREFEEETGVKRYRVFPQVRFSEQYHFRRKKGQRVNKTVTYFLSLVALDGEGALAPVKIQAKEISEYRWCSAKDAEALIEFEGSLQVLAECEVQLGEMDWSNPDSITIEND